MSSAKKRAATRRLLELTGNRNEEEVIDQCSKMSIQEINGLTSTLEAQGYGDQLAIELCKRHKEFNWFPASNHWSKLPTWRRAHGLQIGNLRFHKFKFYLWMRCISKNGKVDFHDWKPVKFSLLNPKTKTA